MLTSDSGSAQRSTIEILYESMQSTFADSFFSQEDIYQMEIHRLSYHLQQEPFLHLPQRYSHRLLSSLQKIVGNSDFIQINAENEMQPAIEKKIFSKYTIHRVEPLSGLFKQAKIYAIIDVREPVNLKNLCFYIQEQFSVYHSLVICIYRENEAGIAMAKGENVYFSIQDILNSWLVFYTYNLGEGDYFDDKPGKYFGS